MTTRRSVFELIFRGDSSQARQAAAEVKGAVAAVTAETTGSLPVTDRDTAAQTRNAEARRRAAAATREQAEAERRAREDAARSVATIPGAGLPGARPATGGTPQSLPAPAPAPALPPIPTPTQDELERMRASFAPLFAVQRQYQAELEGIAKAETAGAFVGDEASRARERARANYERMTESVRRADAASLGHAGTMRLQSHEARILSMQMTDTFQTLALGMSPLQVLLQQGPQVVDILGGVGNTFRWIQQVLTPMRLLIGGSTAAILAGAAAWDQYGRSVNAVNIALEGRGQRVALTAGEAEAIAMQAAGEAGISRRDSRALQAQLIGSGQIGADAIPRILGLSADFAATQGITPDQLGPELVRLFSDPAKAAGELYVAGGQVNAQQRERIELLQAENDRMAAQVALAEALAANLVDASEARSGFARVTQPVGRLFSDAWDLAGQTIAGGAPDSTSLADQIGRLRELIPSAEARIASGQDPAGLVANALPALRAELARLEARLAEQEAQAATMFGPRAIDLATRIRADNEPARERVLRSEITALEKGLQAPDLSDNQRSEITAAIEEQQQALDNLLNRRAYELEMDGQELRMAAALNPVRRAEIAADIARLQARMQGANAIEQAHQAERAYARTVREAIVTAGTSAEAMRQEAQGVRYLTDMRALGVLSASELAEAAERESVLAPLRAAADAAEGETKQELAAIIAELGGAYEDLGRARREADAQSDTLAARDRITDLQLELALIGQTRAVQERARAEAAADRRLRDLGLAPDNPKAAALRAELIAEAEAQIALDRARRVADLGTQGMLAGYDSALRATVDPVARAEITAQREYALAVSEGADAEEAAARAALARSRALDDVAAGIADVIRQQDQQLARLRLEAALAGQPQGARDRALALFDADAQIRELGASGADADMIRRAALATADQRLETERLAEAWDRVRQAAEGAIDGPIDALLNGDPEGALSGFADQIRDLFADLAIKNPLKNGLLGTDLPTLDDVGGLQGILRSLLGGDPVMAQTVSSMDITAANVTLAGAGVAGLFGAGGPSAPANIPFGPGSGVLSGPADVQDQVWRFFAARGLQPHHIAGIMGNVQAESAFDPTAVGDDGNAFGLFQWNNRRHALFDFIGGQQNLGNVQAQLEFAWHELMTSERPAFERLMGTTNAADATNAFMRGFERPAEWAMQDSWGSRLGAAEEALARFGATANTAQADLGLLGQGFGAFGNALSGIGGDAGGGGFWLDLIGLAGRAFSLPGFRVGGATGGSNPDRVAGLVHEEEYVFDAEATRRIGVTRLDAIRRGDSISRRAGAVIVAGAPVLPANQASAPAVIHLQPIFQDHTSGGLQVRTEDYTDSRGQPQQKFILSDAVSAGVRARGGSAHKTLRGLGLRDEARRRG